MPASKAWVSAPMPSQPTCSASTTDLMVSTPMCGWKTGIDGGVGSVTGTPEVAVGRAREQELAVDARVDLEAVGGLEELPYGGLGIVALAPRPSREQLVGQVLDQRVEDDEIAVARHQRRVQLELAQHVVMRVVGVENHHHRTPAARVLAHRRHHRRIDRRALDQANPPGQRMTLDLAPV